MNASHIYKQRTKSINVIYRIPQEYSKFISVDPGEDAPEPKRPCVQRTLDGVVKKARNPYSFKEGRLIRLMQNVVRCCVETMIPLRALSDRSFDTLVKDIDPRLTVSSFC